MYMVKKALKEVEASCTIVSLDLETRSMYTKAQRELAKIMIGTDNLSIQKQNEYSRIIHSSGLSHPSMINVTHVILGLSDDHSIVFVIEDDRIERYVFNWLVYSNMRFIVHNASFDLKIIHYRTGRFPKDYEDTQQLAKSLINDCNNYHSRTGLKLLVGSHYPPAWSIKEETDFEVKNLKNEKFIEYAATDGAATLKLWSILQDTINEGDEDDVN